VNCLVLDLAALGLQLDSILKVSSNLNDCVILFYDFEGSIWLQELWKCVWNNNNNKVFHTHYNSSPTQ